MQLSKLGMTHLLKFVSFRHYIVSKTTLKRIQRADTKNTTPGRTEEQRYVDKIYRFYTL